MKQHEHDGYPSHPTNMGHLDEKPSDEMFDSLGQRMIPLGYRTSIDEEIRRNRED